MAIYKLGDIGSFKGGISKLNKNKYGEGIVFINYMDVFANSIITNTGNFQKYNASEKEYLKYALIEGDALFTASSETINEIAMSAVYLSQDKAIFNGFSKRYRFKTNILLPKYAAYLFRTQEFRSKLQTLATGYTRFNISQHNLAGISIQIPNINLQNKIIDIIEPHEKLFLNYSKCVRIDKLENTKKDIQQIIDIIEPFEQYITLLGAFVNKMLIMLENIYKLSSKKKTFIKDIAKVEIGGTPPTKENKFWNNGNIPWINSGSLTDTFITKPTNKYITLSALSKTKLANKGDLLFSNVYPAKNKIALAKNNLTFSGHVFKLTAYKNLYFEIRGISEFFKIVQKGSVLKEIGKKDILNTKINLSEINFDKDLFYLIKVFEIKNKLIETKEKLINLLIK